MIGNKKSGGSAAKLKTIMTVLILVAVVVMFLIGSRESKVTLVDNSIKISGMYGTTIGAEEIKEIALKDEIPKVGNKTNGMDVGKLKKGYFRMAEIDKAKLYLHAKGGPYIEIVTNTDIIFINFKDAEKTKSIYEEIKVLK